MSAIWPGLGQLYLGHRRAALVYGVPILAALGLLGAQAAGGLERLGFALLVPSVALTVAILIGLLGLWRLLSMVDAFLAAGGRRGLRGHPGRLTAAILLSAAVVAVHGLGAYYAWSFYEAGSRIFVAEPAPPSQPGPTPSSGAEPSGLAGFPEATPVATPPSASARINVLLIGTDWAPTRDHSLTDTLLVVSVEPPTKSVVMVSLPRDLARFPLFDGRTYNGKINSLLTYAEQHRAEFPDGGMTTLVREVGYLVGVPIHYYAAINLPGFEAMIDAVGGVRIYNETLIDDPMYANWRTGRIGFRLGVGWHTLDGETALAYVRSRMGVGNNDFERARRQQQLLIALKNKLTDPAMLPRVPDLLAALGNTIRTNFPAERLLDMIDLGRQIEDGAIARKVLGPPYAKRATDTSIYMLVPDMAAFARVSVELFGSDSRYAGGSSAP